MGNTGRAAVVRNRTDRRHANLSILAAVGLEDHTVHIVEVGSGEHRQVIEFGGKPWALGFSPGGGGWRPVRSAKGTWV